MDWSDNAIVLSTRKYGENDLLVSLLTENHGRYMGYVKGGLSKSKSPIYQVGNIVNARWAARLEEQLGLFICELDASVSARYMSEAGKLNLIVSACAMAETSLPERAPIASFYHHLKDFLCGLDETCPIYSYIKLEVCLLEELGYGLDFSCCAASGGTENLVYVSPKSGRAVSLIAGEPYKNKLLPLPSFMLADNENNNQAEDVNEIKKGFVLTGYFFERHLNGVEGKKLPPARVRLVDRFAI